MRRATYLLWVSLVFLTVPAARSAAQSPIALTDKLTDLQGTWVRDPTRGVGGICGVNPPDELTITVSPSELTIDAAADSGARAATAIRGRVRLDGTPTALATGRTVTVATDAGWLALTLRTARTGGFTNVLRDVFIPLRGELTVWRTLNVERPDGLPDKIDCGNHQAIIYTRK